MGGLAALSPLHGPSTTISRASMGGLAALSPLHGPSTSLSWPAPEATQVYRPRKCGLQQPAGASVATTGASSCQSSSPGTYRPCSTTSEKQSHPRSRRWAAAGGAARVLVPSSSRGSQEPANHKAAVAGRSRALVSFSWYCGGTEPVEESRHSPQPQPDRPQDEPSRQRNVHREL